MIFKDRRNIIEVLNLIEEKYCVAKWEMYGFRVWPIIRMLAYFKLWQRCINNRNNDNQNNTNIIGYIDILQKISSSIFCSYKKIYDVKEYVFLNNSGCKRLVDNIWVDVFCDPIIKALGKENCTVLEWDNAGYKDSTYIDSLKIQNDLDKIKIKTKLQTFKKKKCYFHEYDAVNNLLNNVLDEINVLYSIELINNYRKYFLRYFCKHIPKLAFTTIYYNEIGMGFVLACKSVKCKTIDIQHGMQVGNNPAYTSWVNVPQDGYELMPDVFMVRGSEEEKNIRQWCHNNIQVIKAGDLWLNEWLDDNNDFVRKYDIIFDKIKKGYKATILFTLDYQSIPDVLILLIKRMPKDILWLIRLHPADLQNINIRKEELNGIDNVNLDDASNLPLHALLRNIDIHITDYSGVVLEAEKFGVMSVILSKSESKLFQKTIDAGHAVALFEIDELEDSITDVIRNKKKQRFDKQVQGINNIKDILMSAII